MNRRLLAGAALTAGLVLVTAAHAGVIAAVATVPGAPGFTADTPVPGFLSVALLWAGGALLTCTGCVLWLRVSARSPAAAPGRPWPGSRRTLLYLSPALAYLGVPMGHLVGPLIVWRCTAPPDAETGLELCTLLEFQLTVTVFAVAAVMLCALIVGFFLLAALVVCHLGLTVVTVVQALRGRAVHLPLVVGFLR